MFVTGANLVDFIYMVFIVSSHVAQKKFSSSGCIIRDVMNTNHAVKIITLVLITFIANTKLLASDIYHWVDENGVSHYSQYQPGDDTPNVSTQKLENTAPPGNGEVEDVYNVAAHEKHMAEWREDRDNKRADVRARNEQAARQHSTRNSESYSTDSGSYLYPPIFGRQPVRPRPPIVRPRPPSGLHR